MPCSRCKDISTHNHLSRYRSRLDRSWELEDKGSLETLTPNRDIKYGALSPGCTYVSVRVSSFLALSCFLSASSILSGLLPGWSLAGLDPIVKAGCRGVPQRRVLSIYDALCRFAKRKFSIFLVDGDAPRYMDISQVGAYRNAFRLLVAASDLLVAL